MEETVLPKTSNKKIFIIAGIILLVVGAIFAVILLSSKDETGARSYYSIDAGKTFTKSGMRWMWLHTILRIYQVIK